MGLYENKLSDEALEGVNGGGYFNAGGLITGDNLNKKSPFEVINDQNGQVIARFENEADALKFIGDSNGYISSRKYSWNDVTTLRG